MVCVLGAKLSSAHVSENEDAVQGEAELNSSNLHTADELHTHDTSLKPKINLLHILQQGWHLRYGIFGISVLRIQNYGKSMWSIIFMEIQ